MRLIINFRNSRVGIRTRDRMGILIVWFRWGRGVRRGEGRGNKGGKKLLIWRR